MIVYWISSRLSTIIIAFSGIVLSLHCCLVIATEIWSIKLLPYRVFYWTLRKNFFVFIIYPLCTCILIFLQIARIF